MTPEFIAILALALYLLAGMLVLFLGGRLVQHDLDPDASKKNTASPRSRVIGDLRPIQHLTVDFFARAEPCDRLLTILARHQEPLAVTALLQKARPSAEQSDDNDAPAFGIEWAALRILRVAGLVSLNKRNVSHRCGVKFTDAYTGRRCSQDRRESPGVCFTTRYLLRAHKY